MVPADAAVPEAGPLGAVQQQIRVVPRDGGEARVEFGGNARAPQHRGRARQVRIDAAHPGVMRPRDRRVEVHDLRRRVHAGIGASGGDDAHRARRRSRRARARAHPARRSATAATGSRRRRGRRTRGRVHAHRARLPNGKKRRGFASTRRPSSDIANRRAIYAVSFASSDCASDFCWSSPSCSTSCRISRAPSTSPIS